ncbi:acyltransferase family protein [Agilicoccus flavus]|uniref:acyltransferase family protein n=1 Tax=Agilicoccus flavus TaxID=2775968 RepID=UPI001CF68B87|nr:acyltransferase family protein [Agilicoccus flavus]
MSQPAPAPARSRRGTRPRRLDALDGLRTVAVFLVIAYHVSLPFSHGGFLGVDVFFVLSGYLITTLLLTELTHRGRIDLARFWMRRVLRLLPASIVVILTVLVWAMIAAPPFRRPGLGADALWSLLYVGNWRFISTSSYFAADGTMSPLQHVWSLAVEEQFYLLWPLLLAGLGALALRRARTASDGPIDSAGRNERNADRRRRTATAALVAAGALILGSVVLMATLYDPSGPDRAYMGTDTKAFEPLLGAFGAALMARPGVRRVVTERSQPLMWLGLAGVVAGVATLGDSHAPSPLYFRGGAFAFALACLVLVAATSVADRRRGLTLVLGSTPMAYLGRISYGIYLWHWPLAVWIIDGHGFSPRRAALVVALTVALAALSYHLIETPIRSGRPARWHPRRVLVQAAGVMAVVALVTSMLGGTPLNTVVPALASGTQSDRTVVVVGDSVMRRLVPALDPVAARRDLTVLNAARGGCPAIGVPALDVDGTLLAGGSCAQEVPEAQTETIEQAKPGVVVWWSRYELADRQGPDGRPLVAGTDEFWAAQKASLAEAVDRLTATGARLVIVDVDRVGDGIDTRCTPQKCHAFLDRLRNHDDLRRTWNGIVREYAQRDPRVVTVRVDDLYCRDDGNPCDDHTPARLPGARFAAPGGAEYARPDGSHFSGPAMTTVSTGLLDRVAEATGASWGTPPAN